MRTPYTPNTVENVSDDLTATDGLNLCLAFPQDCRSG